MSTGHRNEFLQLSPSSERMTDKQTDRMTDRLTNWTDWQTDWLTETEYLTNQIND